MVHMYKYIHCTYEESIIQCLVWALLRLTPTNKIGEAIYSQPYVARTT